MEIIKNVNFVAVYSTFGVTAEQVADHKWLKRMRTMEQNKLQTDQMEPRTNIYNPRIDTTIKYEISSYVAHTSDKVREFDEIYTEDNSNNDNNNNNVFEKNLNIPKHLENTNKNRLSSFVNFLPKTKHRVKREGDDPRCSEFNFSPLKSYIQHPHEGGSKSNYYYSKMDCVTVIEGKSVVFLKNHYFPHIAEYGKKSSVKTL